MSVSFPIQAKTYGASLEYTKNAIIVPAGGAVQRETALSSTWTRCRIAILYGFTNLSDNFGIPNEESCAAYSSQLLSWQIGLTDNINGMPGASGTKFVGAGRTNNSGYLSRIHNNGTYWQLARDSGGNQMNYGLCATNGTSDVIKYGDISSLWRATTPSSGVNFLSGIGFDITLLSGGGLTISSNCNQYNISDPSSYMLNKILTGDHSTGSGSTSSGGWWDLSSTWSGCQCFFVRFPFLSNRLIIYGYEVMQLA